MVKHLKEVWQTTDGRVFGSESEATYHEETVIYLQAVNNLRDDLVRAVDECCTRGVYYGSYQLRSSKLEELLKRHGFHLKRKRDERA